MRSALLLALFALGPTVSAQGRPVEVWLTLNGGLLEVGPVFTGVGASLSVGRTVAGRVAVDAVEEFTLGAPPTSVRSVSAGAGIRANERRVHFEAYAGPALTWGLDEVDPDRQPRGREPYTTLGLALDGVAFLEVGRGFGVGTVVHANVNPTLSALGARLGLFFQLGRRGGSRGLEDG